MTIVNINTGEVVEPLTFNEAVELTDSIRVSVADLEEMVVRAYQGRVWLALEYESWDDYVEGEFKQAPLALPREERRTQVASLRQQGLSIPAIASATGAGVGTVHRDIDAAFPNGKPERTTGVDGKDYPAVRPDQVIEMSQIEAETSDTPPEVREACPTCGQILPVELRKEA